MLNIQPKTHEERMRDHIIKIDEHATISVENAKSNYQSAFDLLWNAEYGTPQEICDALGNQAYKLFENAMIWIGTIRKFDPTWVPPSAPNEFAVNPDGTVKIGEPITPKE